MPSSAPPPSMHALGGMEDIPVGVVALLTCSSTDVLSHVAIRASCCLGRKLRVRKLWLTLTFYFIPAPPLPCRLWVAWRTSLMAWLPF